jgi:transposase-like protein
VEKQGQTRDLRLTEHCETEAARRFLQQALCRHGVPAQLTSDDSEVNEAALKSSTEASGSHISIRQVKYETTSWHKPTSAAGHTSQARWPVSRGIARWPGGRRAPADCSVLG